MKRSPLVLIALLASACSSSAEMVVACADGSFPDPGSPNPCGATPDEASPAAQVASWCSTPLGTQDPSCNPYEPPPARELPEDVELRTRGLEPVETGAPRRVWCRTAEGAIIACRAPSDPVHVDLELLQQLFIEDSRVDADAELTQLTGDDVAEFTTSPGPDLACGSSGFKVRLVDGPVGPGAESCFTSKYSGHYSGGGYRVFCSVASTHGGGGFDGFGWIVQADKSGRFYSGGDGYGDPVHAGWADYRWTSQWGGDYTTGTPLGLTIDPATGTIYIVDGGRLDFDGNPATPPAPFVAVLTASGQPSHAIPLVDPATGAPLTTPNDVALGFYGQLYITDSSFANLSNSAIFRVDFPADPVAATVEKWLNVGSTAPAPNPIRMRLHDTDGNGVGDVEAIYIATLGTVLDPFASGHNGKLVRVLTGSKQLTTLATGFFADGLTWRSDLVGGGWAVGDLASRKILRVPVNGGAPTLLYDLSPYTHQIGGMSWVGPWNGSLFVTMYGAGRPGILRVSGS